MPLILPVDDTSIARAADMLRDGKLVAFPTETVYGLGADATNGQAVAAIYAAKGRPSINPLIVHAVDARGFDHLVEWNDTAELLATSLWPGPLTLILPRKKDAAVSLLVSAGMDTLAVRVPSHPIARKLLAAVGRPIAAPSANRSGKLSPTAPAHVAESLGEKVDLILAGGRSQIGVESTVLNLTSPTPTLLRHGGVTREQLEMVLGHKIDVYEASATEENALPSPGMLASHYAPSLPLRLNVEKVQDNEAFLLFGPDSFLKGGAVRLNLSPSADLNEAAANLFSMLRELDNPIYAGIAVAPIPVSGLGAALNDRLRRAALR